MDPVRVLMLRGVNVGGANRLPMADFREMLGQLGLRDPQTYIQSGNAVFGSDLPDQALAAAIGEAMAARFGFAPALFLRDAAQMQRVLTDHPFAAIAPDRVHAVFTAGAGDEPKPDLDLIDRLRAPSEAWHLGPGVFYLATPEGLGTSKLAVKLAQVIRGPHTARNLRSVAALVALAQARKDARD